MASGPTSPQKVPNGGRGSSHSSSTSSGTTPRAASVVPQSYNTVQSFHRPIPPRRPSGDSSIGPSSVVNPGVSTLTSAFKTHDSSRRPSIGAAASTPTHPPRTDSPSVNPAGGAAGAVGAKPAERAFLKQQVVGLGGGEDDNERGRLLERPGGDVAREVALYLDQGHRETEPRSRSVEPPRTTDGPVAGDLQTPGVFRREFIRNQADRTGSESSSGRIQPNGGTAGGYNTLEGARQPQMPATRDFFEFLMVSQFAGEMFDDDESDEREDGDEADERTGLLSRGGRTWPQHSRSGEQPLSSSQAALLLVKSFVGTGVLFLPRAFMNGGLAFSVVTLTAVAAISLFCFILLLDTRLALEGALSFGDMGKALYGKNFRRIINLSLTVSQIGFASAYIVFTSENLRVVTSVLSNGAVEYPVPYFIAFQCLVFVPCALLRRLDSLKRLTVFANAFIGMALVCLYYYDIRSLMESGLGRDIAMFNPDSWSLFVGTAVFTFEGIGLIIPIQSSMMRPTELPKVLSVVMVGITTLFLTVGALSYVAYGADTKTVVLLNLPQDDELVVAIQLIYSVAILFSTPLQLFPATDLTCLAIFSARSGKRSGRVKWAKNFVRCCVVVVTAAIAWVGANNLDRFVSLVGSFACIPLVYIYPPMLHYRTVAETRRQRAADVAMAVFGLAMMVYTTFLTLAAPQSGGGDGN